ncbi:hypothetical protein PM082_010880 [Marasmius tenuissimus]|nr:hypothetical protein PM082_010880 [Marasmius tenuissimus]
MPPTTLVVDSNNGVPSVRKDLTGGGIIIVCTILGVALCAVLLGWIMHWRARIRSGDTDLGSVQVHLPATKEAFTSNNHGPHGLAFSRTKTNSMSSSSRSTTWLTSNWKKFSAPRSKSNNQADSSFMNL